MVEGSTAQDVDIPSGEIRLRAIFGTPPRPRGIVIFAHGSGSGRLSPRNNAVAGSLQVAGFTTVLVDLLTERESLERASVFDIELLARRLIDCTRWVLSLPKMRTLPIGYFGASTGAGAALVAASHLGSESRAVVSRGGRPDLAGPHLAHVVSPTLLIVGGADEPVIRLNEQAMEAIEAVKELSIVSGATHLFEEPGALEEVARLACDWFTRYLV